MLRLHSSSYHQPWLVVEVGTSTTEEQRPVFIVLASSFPASFSFCSITFQKSKEALP